MTRLLAVLAAILGSFLIAAAGAAEELSETNAHASSSVGADLASSIGSAGIKAPDLAQWLLSCLFVLALIFLLAWSLRRMQVHKGYSKTGVRVVSSAMLGRKERVAVIEAAGREFLVGVAEGRVSLISELTKSKGSESSASIDKKERQGEHKDVNSAAAVPDFGSMLDGVKKESFPDSLENK